MTHENLPAYAKFTHRLHHCTHVEMDDGSGSVAIYCLQCLLDLPRGKKRTQCPPSAAGHLAAYQLEGSEGLAKGSHNPRTYVPVVLISGRFF